MLRMVARGASRRSDFDDMELENVDPQEAWSFELKQVH